MKILILFFLSFFSVEVLGQDKDTIFIDPETPPSFPGGYDSLKSFVAKNLKYPKENVEGRVYVEFIVNEDGSLSDAKIIKGLCVPCDKNALEVFSKMPKWIPGKVHDKPVKTKMIYPIKYSLGY